MESTAAKATPRWVLWMGGFFIAAGVYFIAEELLGLGPLPYCDQVSDDLERIYGASQYARLAGLSAVSSSNYKQLSENPTTRRCAATLQLNNALTTRVVFSVYRDGRGKLMVEFVAAP